MDEALPSYEKERPHWMQDLPGHGVPCTVETARSSCPSSGPYRGPVQQSLFPKPIASTDFKTARSSVTDPVASRRRSHFMKHWWLEVAACVISILSLIAIIVTLQPHQNKPLPQWPYNISVNSLISVYVVVLKASALLVIAEGLGKQEEASWG